MAVRQPLSIVVRIPAVRISKSELETALRSTVDRYEQSNASGYAQIDIAEAGDPWSEAHALIQQIASPIRRLVADGAIGCPIVDVALRFPDSVLSVSAAIPSSLIEVVDSAAMSIDISVYRTT